MLVAGEGAGLCGRLGRGVGLVVVAGWGWSWRSLFGLVGRRDQEGGGWVELVIA